MTTFGIKNVHSGIAFSLFGTSIHGKSKKLQCNGSILSQRCAFVQKIHIFSPEKRTVCYPVRRKHSYRFQGLCLTKRSSETLQNLPYFIYTITQSCFFHFSFRATLFFPQMNALVYVDIDQGIH